MTVKILVILSGTLTDPGRIDRGQYCRVADPDSQSRSMDPVPHQNVLDNGLHFVDKCENVYKKPDSMYRFPISRIERAHSCLEGPILLKCGR
jgi:hypothetical protein